MKKLLLVFLSVIMALTCVTACGSKKINVTFDGNGGKTSDGQTTVTMPYEKGEEFITPIFTKTDYVFIGWDKELDNIEQSTTVKAQWIKAFVQVNFNYDGGIDKDNLSEMTVKFYYNTVKKTYGVEAPEITKKGYTLTGWDVDLTTITEDKSVKAIWSANDISVVFNGNGGKTSDDKESVTINAKVGETITAPTFTKENYTFIGWDKEYTSLTESTTITAQWVLDGTEVIFDGNGGKTADNETTVTCIIKDNDTSNVPTFTRDGYKFKGWNFVDETHASAVWAKLITVTFVGNGGKTTDNKETVVIENHEVGTTLTAPIFTKDNYKFAGWTIGQNDVTSIDDITETCTVTANWADAEVSITVSYNSKGGQTVASTTVIKGTAITAEQLPSITKGQIDPDGYKEYTFTGWSYNGKMLKAGDIWNMDASEITLVAVWESGYTGFY